MGLDNKSFKFRCGNCGRWLSVELSYCSGKLVPCNCGYGNQVSYCESGLYHLSTKQKMMIQRYNDTEGKAQKEQNENIKRNGLLYPNTAAGRYYDERVAEGMWPPREEAIKCETH